MTNRTILHAGPRLPQGHRPADALRATIIGAALHEEWAKTPAEADHLIESDELDLQPACAFNAAATYCGGITPSMPVVVVGNRTTGTRAYAALNEGRGKVLRYGVYE
jgi:hypothetical protein